MRLRAMMNCTAVARLLSRQGAHAEAAGLYREVLAVIRRIKTFARRWRKCCRGRNSLTRLGGCTGRCYRRSRLQIEARRGLAEVAHWRGDRSEALERYEALLAETQDPESEERLRAIRAEIQAAVPSVAEPPASALP